MTTTSTLAAAAGTTPASTTAAASTSLGSDYNNFLKLLITQLQNQDPTAPLDTNQFTSQLVQYSSVEQQINTNTNLTKLIDLQSGNQVLQSSALVGKSVQITSDHISLQNGTAGLQLTATTAEPVKVAIYNESGVKIRDAAVQAQPGPNNWTWDGRDNYGHAVADGAYKVTVQSAGSAGSQDVPFTVTGTATGVTRSANALNLQVGSLQVPLTSVQAVR